LTLVGRDLLPCAAEAVGRGPSALDDPVGGPSQNIAEPSGRLVVELGRPLLQAVGRGPSASRPFYRPTVPLLQPDDRGPLAEARAGPKPRGRLGVEWGRPRSPPAELIGVGRGRRLSPTDLSAAPLCL